MSRHTLADGLTPDPEITPDTYDLWLPELAPPLKLVGSWYRRQLSWNEFAEQYTRSVRVRDIELRQLLDMAARYTVTLLCVESTPHRCHRRLLALECERRAPGIVSFDMVH
jgi:uncharacterized protein YeaO (DUF488 family)